ncbi:hypothetical protein M3Y97_01103100 [Aphelenchoides bicaudatus]|nr:hypothetical protein M3Y97_01103100 [Aphelenchoides bicaudatus]
MFYVNERTQHKRKMVIHIFTTVSGLLLISLSILFMYMMISYAKQAKYNREIMGFDYVSEYWTLLALYNLIFSCMMLYGQLSKISLLYLPYLFLAITEILALLSVPFFLLNNTIPFLGINFSITGPHFLLVISLIAMFLIGLFFFFILFVAFPINSYKLLKLELQGAFRSESNEEHKTSIAKPVYTISV